MGNAKEVSFYGANVEVNSRSPAKYIYQYTLASSTMQANTAPKPLTVSELYADYKYYDGMTSAVISGALTSADIIAGDNVSISMPTGSFVDKNVKENKPIILSGLSISGNDNYEIKNLSLTSNITPAPLVLKADNKIKTIGENDPVLTYTYTGLVNEDISAEFEKKLYKGNINRPGIYKIYQGSLVAKGNYFIDTYILGKLIIIRRPMPNEINKHSYFSFLWA